jgi:type II secretory pathway pseudopilin PulG
MEESMKDLKNTAGAPAAGAKPAKKRNRILHLLSEMWPAYLIEVVVIIVGISITLVLEEWRDKSKESELEKVYLTNLAADIESDRRSLHYALSSTDTLLAAGAEIQQFVEAPDQHPLTAAGINKDVRALISRPKFLSHDATFSELKSSGNLHLIKEVTLNWNLFSYYSKAENIKENQEAEQLATIELSGRYFLQYFALDGSGESPVFRNPGGVRSLATNAEFRNHVLARVGTRQELQRLYKDTDSLAAQLLAMLHPKE